MRRAPIMLLCVSIALTAVACGRVTDEADASTPETPVPTFDMTAVTSKSVLGAFPGSEPLPLPTSAGGWVFIGEQAPATPLCATVDAASGRLVAVSADGEINEVRTADGALILDPGVSTPPAARVGDPVAIAALDCERRESLLLGTIGEDGAPTGLVPILGRGAPAGAPAVDTYLQVRFVPSFSADRTTLLVNVLSDCSAEIACTRSELWNYDLRAESWSMRRDPTYPDGWWGLPLILSDGSVFEVVEESGYRWTTFRGATLYGRDDYVSAAMLAPDGNSALFRVEDISGWTESVQIVGTDGIPRKVYETPIEGDIGVSDGEVDTAGFGPDPSTVYLGLWSTGTDTHLSLWSVDIATGTKEELLRIATYTYSSDLPYRTTVPSVILLPDGSGALVQTWDEVWELWTFAKAD